MEVTLKVILNKPCGPELIVSILVLMEVTLKALSSAHKPREGPCFNPCFNGSDSKRRKQVPVSSQGSGFNPCFNGSDSKRDAVRMPFVGCLVSILVLMEVTLKGESRKNDGKLIFVSILVLMEVTLKG